MKERKIPMRTCVITHEKLPKKELIRIVRNKENKVFVDETGKQNGKGAYLKLDESVVEKARKSKVLNKYLKIDVEDKIYDDVLKLIKK